MHSGHISYLNHASHLGDWLIVGLNSDAWLTRKKGRPFMSWQERMTILDNLHMTDRIIEFDDDDDTAIDAIKKVKELFPDDKIIFANGGDRTKDNIPEMVFEDVEFVFGIGGNDKKNSSSWILDDWKSPKTKRPWGYYRIIHEHNAEVKVKELVVDPGQCLSMQRHENRSEHWFIVEGKAEVYTVNKKSSDYEFLGIFNKHQTIHINKSEWHQLCNPSKTPLKIVEIQYGTDCKEEDIERK